jgi:hypothetical protein
MPVYNLEMKKEIKRNGRTIAGIEGPERENRGEGAQ